MARDLALTGDPANSLPMIISALNAFKSTGAKFLAPLDLSVLARTYATLEPHAIILTERTRPEPIFVAALIGASRLLRVDFDLDGDRESYVKKSLKGIQRRPGGLPRVVHAQHLK